MTTTVGTNTVTSIARHFIMPQITDMVYSSNVLLYRLIQGNKRMIQGGRHIEVPLMYKRFTTGGAYSGLDVFAVAPQDTIKNAAFPWKQYQITWAIDGLTMIQSDSPEAIANLLTLQSQQAYMEMGENLAVGLFGDGAGTVTGTKELDGLAGLVGTGSSIGNQTYGNLDRTSNTFWNSSVTGITSTQTMSKSTLMTGWTACQRGGQAPTLIVSGQDQWNRYWALGETETETRREVSAQDSQLYQAGFHNLVFNGTPWIADSHVTEGVVDANNSRVYMLNENFLHWVVSPRADFYLKPFQEPHDQDGMVASILFAGNLVCTNTDQQGGVFNFNA